jgi:hypothetical protein
LTCCGGKLKVPWGVDIVDTGESAQRPIIGHPVWVLATAGPEQRKVPGWIVGVGADGFLGCGNSMTVELGPGHICSVVIGLRGIQWDYGYAADHLAHGVGG